MKGLRRFLAFGLKKQALLIRSMLLLLGFRIALRVVAFRQLVGWVERMRRVPLSRPDIEYGKRIGWAVDTAGRALGGTCLERALTAQFIMARRGHWATLRIGIKPPKLGVLHAHAWLEYQSRVIVGGKPRSLKQYTTLPNVEVGP